MSTTVTTVVNGILPSEKDAANELAEFEKILKLRDDIFAGKHPRLTVPAHLLRKASPPSSSPSSAQVHAPNQYSSIQLPGLGLKSQADELPPKAGLPALPVTTASGIHPALLTKSDDLVRAETALHRQRLEKQLRDQFEQKRLEFRKKPAPNEAKPDFDISALLAKALDVVKPIALSKGESDKEDENDSVNENSFYSSRAPDSTPERGDASASSQDEGVAQEKNGDLATVGRFDTQASQGKRPIDYIRPNPFQKGHDSTMADADDEDEEGEYSPPDADPFAARNGTNGNTAPSADPRRRPTRSLKEQDHAGRRAASPMNPDLRIVRNHITSPLAPQPSRVSPLAFTKDSLVSQDRQHDNGRQRMRANSLSHSPENFSARPKKRKLDRGERKADKRLRKGIKQENISPPPFHDIQPLGLSKPQPDDRPIVIDEPPQAQEMRYVPAPQYVGTPQRPMSRQTEYLPASEPRILSRTSMRPRDDQDLRRVASLHNLRMEQPQEQAQYVQERPRATSYMRVDSPAREIIRDYASDTERPMQEVRVIRTPAPEYREVYANDEPEVRYIPEPMAPPPRERIVVDQYGRRFREIVQERASVAPRAVSSYQPRESAAPPTRYQDEFQPSRAGSVMVEERPVPRFEHDMPPPPRLMRPITSQPASPTTREFYEPMPDARIGGGALYERPSTRQVVYTDHAPEYQPTPRMSSQRPQPLPTQAPVQYEELPPRQVVPRAASVRPAPQHRESSNFVEDRGTARHEYLPMEAAQQPRYRMVEQPQYPQELQHAPRYVDSQGREVIYAPSPAQGDGGVRYVQGY